MAPQKEPSIHYKNWAGPAPVGFVVLNTKYTPRASCYETSGTQSFIGVKLDAGLMISMEVGHMG